MFNLDWKFQSEIGRLKVSIPERNLEFFQSLGPLGSSGKRLSIYLARGDHPNSWKNAPRIQGQMKSFLETQQCRESLRELLRELWFLCCSGRERPFREWNFAFRESVLDSQSSENGLFTPRAFFLICHRALGAPKGATSLLHFSKCSRSFIQSVKSTLSDLKSCNPVGGTLSSTAWILGWSPGFWC